MAKCCIGVDLGGTFIKFGVLDSDHKPGKTFQLPTPTDRGSDGVIGQMIAGAREAISRAGLSRDDVVGVGIGAPGPLDLKAGLVLAMPNIAGMDNVALRDRVSQGVGLPAVLENDANAAAYGEYLCGAGRESGDLVLLTLGTGVGGGVIIDGKVLHGSHGIGAELGHMMIIADGELCGCGQRGCLERYCSATFMSQRARRRMETDNCPTSLRAVAAEKGAITAKDINEARRAGDAFAASVWGEMARNLARGCVNICRILDPERIVLGGGMAAAGKDLLDPVMENYRALHWSLTEPRTNITLAELGNDAGVIGAAGVAWQALAT